MDEYPASGTYDFQNEKYTSRVIYKEEIKEAIEQRTYTNSNKTKVTRKVNGLKEGICLIQEDKTSLMTKYSHGKKHGLEVGSYDSEIVRSTNYVEGKEHGLETIVFPNNKINTMYEKGKIHGLREEIGLRSNLLSRANYANNMLHGKVERWNERGELIYRGFFKRDQKHGLEEIYVDEKPAYKCLFIEGKRTGLERVWRNGEIRSQVSYVNGRKEGVQNWYRKSVLVGIVEYSNGKRIKHTSKFDKTNK